MSDVNTVTSVEQDGRTLSGVGVEASDLEAVMERHAPEPKPETEAAPVAATDKPTDAAPAPEEKPKRGAQRFSDLTHERDLAKAEAATAKAERETLARERDELKARLDKPAAEPVAAKPAVAELSKLAERFTFPDYETFLEAHPEASYNQWEIDRLQAFGDWKDQRTDLDGRIRQGMDADRAMREAQTTVERTRSKGRESYADFDAVLKSGPGASVALGPTEDEARQRCAFIFAHPQSEHLQYAIMKDGELAKRLGAMDAMSFGVELAKLTPSSTHTAPTRRTPPAPYQPVNGASATTAIPSSELAAKGNFDSYRAQRAKERGVKAKYR